MSSSEILKRKSRHRLTPAGHIGLHRQGIMMTELSYPWSEYAHVQNRLSYREAVDDTAWGLEAAAGKLLEEFDREPEAGSPSTERAIASSARRNRYSRRLHINFSFLTETSTNPIAGLEARADLSRLRSTLPAREMALLLALARGHEYAELAASIRTSSQALRTRVTRIRRSARAALAA